MKKFLGLIFLILLWSNIGIAEIILLECKYLDGEIRRFKNNYPQKKEPYSPYGQEVTEIRLDPAIEKLIKAPGFDHSVDVVLWSSDEIYWTYKFRLVSAFPSDTRYSLDRMTGILSVDTTKYRIYEGDPPIKRILWDAKYSYNCEKKERIF